MLFFHQKWKFFSTSHFMASRHPHFHIFHAPPHYERCSHLWGHLQTIISFVKTRRHCNENVSFQRICSMFAHRDSTYSCYLFSSASQTATVLTRTVIYLRMRFPYVLRYGTGRYELPPACILSWSFCCSCTIFHIWVAHNSSCASITHLIWLTLPTPTHHHEVLQPNHYCPLPGHYCHRLCRAEAAQPGCL